jgi:hypothetical protein
MVKKKLLLLSLVIILILLFGVSMTAASCEEIEGIVNGPPAIVGFSVSSETNNNSVGEGTVRVNATDSAGNILEYEWSISNGIINNVNENHTTFNVQDLTGTFTIGVKISDQYGGVTEVSIQVTIAEEENAADEGQADEDAAADEGQADEDAAVDDVSGQGEEVIADITVSSATITSGGIGTVSVNATGYDGNISGLDYEWSISGGGAINNDNGNEMTFTAPDNPGTITIGVTISNQSGVVATGSIQITVVGQSGQSSKTVTPQPVEEGASSN